jgi:hypothetical protein
VGRKIKKERFIARVEFSRSDCFATQGVVRLGLWLVKDEWKKQEMGLRKGQLPSASASHHCTCRRQLKGGDHLDPCLLLSGLFCKCPDLCFETSFSFLQSILQEITNVPGPELPRQQTGVLR